MNNSQPWVKWFHSDWRSDPRLRMCSLSARGLWMDMLSYMHEGEPYGHLTIDGIEPTENDIASLVGRPLSEVKKALGELRTRQVFAINDDGVMYSRRMVRDKAKEERDRTNGKGGGNPKLMKVDNEGVNPPDKAQKLEARVQNPDFPLTPKSEEKREKSSRSKPAHQLPSGWKPNENCVEYAKKLGLSDADIVRESERFRNNAQQNARTCSSWDAAWRNWCLKAAEFLKKSPAVNGQNGHALLPLEPPEKPEKYSRDKWQSILKTYGLTGNWKQENGPTPIEDACLVPKDLLRAAGILVREG